MSQKAVTFSIGRKLFLLFGGICAGFFLLAGLAVWQLFSVNEQLNAMSEFQLPALRKFSEIKGSLFMQHAVLDDFVAKAETGNADAAVAKEEFLAAGRQAAHLLGDSQDARALRDFTLKIIDREEQHGHMDDEELKRLDIKHIAEVYRQYIIKAQQMFGLSAGDLSFGIVHDEIDALITDLQNSIMNYDLQVLQFVHEDAEDLSGHTNRAVVAVAVGTLVIFAIALWVVVALVHKITSPLGNLADIAASIAGSDLSIRVDELKSGDELEVLSHSFVEMSGNLRTQIQTMRQSIETLGTAISEIGASIQEQAASAKEEAATIQEITTTMQEIQQSGAEITQRAKDVSSNAEGTLTAGEAGLSAVSKTSESMERIREQVEEVAEKIVSLSEKTQAIGEITATVNEIAEQSNILAINAAIEAASAGESGSRFSVVAQEMKHLAEQAKTSTKMVRGILEEIQKGINTSVMLTEEAVKRTESGRAQAGLAQSNIHKLTESIQSNVQTFQQIIAGNGQQQIGINQVVQGMQDIKQAVQQTVTGISQLEQATRSLNDMSQSLRTFVARYKL